MLKNIYVKRVSMDNGCTEYCMKDETAVPGSRFIYGEPRGDVKNANDQAELINKIENCYSWREAARLPGIKPSNMNWAKEIWATRKVEIKTKIKELYPWQDFLLKKLEDSNDRQIVFFVDYKGNVD